MESRLNEQRPRHGYSDDRLFAGNSELETIASNSQFGVAYKGFIVFRACLHGEKLPLPPGTPYLAKRVFFKEGGLQ
jgi:hypothetical protein